VTGADPGASWLGGGRCRFTVWAPFAERVEVVFPGPQERHVGLEPGPRGYHGAIIEGVEPSSRYLYRLDGGPCRPDPASRHQPEGVHGPSAVFDTASLPWTDASWRGLPLDRYAIYELHVGTFTGEGTFDAVIPHLERLAGLGITAIELMPVAQFPGARNWGYDGVFPFAAQDSYGGPAAMQRLVDACHRHGIAVVLDVVYNHLGPEGNVLGAFGPYFSSRYRTPWGEAINFDGPDSDEVRRFFIGNALYWTGEMHVDALRLDAIHGIFDMSAHPFLTELADAVHDRASATGRSILVTSESDLNDVRVVRPRDEGGHGHDAQWNDDFHHALHAALTGERNGYYADFGRPGQIGKALTEGFVVDWQYSDFRRRRHGSSSREVPPARLVVFSQNHDQVGNRMRGERLGALADFEALKLAAGAVILSPCIPLIFMGEEYGEIAPFQYFVSHTDPGLIEAVRRGRGEEFAAFGWSADGPDPQDESTFLRSRLDHELRGKGHHAVLHRYYAELFRVRSALEAPSPASWGRLCDTGREGVVCVLRGEGRGETILVLNTLPDRARVALPAGRPGWRKLIVSADEAWGGPGSGLPEALEGAAEIDLEPWSVALFRCDEGKE